MSENQTAKESDCWSAFTEWSYSSFPQYLTIQEKKEVFMHSWVPGDAGYWLLFAWRLVCMCVNLFLCFDEIQKNQVTGFKYLTNWGFFFTAITFLLFMVQYGVRFYQVGKAQQKKIKYGETVEVEENVATIFLWQLIVWVYGFCFTANIAITAIYWLFLAGPGIDVLSYLFHITPVVSILIDFVLNLVVIELNLIVWTVLTVLIYFLVNFIYSNYVLFRPVYSIIGWASWQDSLRDVVMYTSLGIVLYLIGWLLTWLKLWLLIGDKPSEDSTKVENEDTMVILI